MEFVIVTGLSGAGKSRAVDALEDIGFYCVDNMPPKLLPKFAELCLQSKETLSRVAIVIDARGGELFDDLTESWTSSSARAGIIPCCFWNATTRCWPGGIRKPAASTPWRRPTAAR